jgi:hypothetical protein
MIQLDINTEAMVVFSARLQSLNRSALPVAVRQTLNQAAFDVKQKTLEQSANKHFIRRAPTFFKAFSGVNKAVGFNINSMQSEVGMTANGKVTAREAIKNMAMQEHGGTIRKGADYLKAARAGNLGKRVTRANYFDKDNLVKGAFSKKGTAKSNMIAAAYVSLKQKKPISINTRKGRFLIQVTGISKYKSKKRKDDVKIRSKLLIQDRNHKPVRIRATHFSQEAALVTQRKMTEFFYAEAKKQFERALR